jgi:hypothetical protein
MQRGGAGDDRAHAGDIDQASILDAIAETAGRRQDWAPQGEPVGVVGRKIDRHFTNHRDHASQNTGLGSQKLWCNSIIAAALFVKAKGRPSSICGERFQVSDCMSAAF